VDAGTGGTTLENCAKIGSNEMTGQVGVCEYTDVCYQPLGLTKSDDVEQDCVHVHGVFTYEICYDNSANMVPVHNVVITDTLPDDTRFMSASDGGVYHMPTHTVTWDIGTVPGGATSCVTMKVLVESGAEETTLENCAAIESDETDPTDVCIDTTVCAPYPTPIGHEPVPALTPLGMILLVGLLMLAGFVALRRRE